MSDVETAPYFLAYLGMMDHLYANCPALKREASSRWRQQRGRTEVRSGVGHVYVDSVDVCGWCRRVWHARKEADV